MIPNASQTACRGFLLRKVGGQNAVPVRQLTTSTGHRIRTASVGMTLMTFLLVVLPVLAMLAVAALALHAGVPHSALALAPVGNLREMKDKRANLIDQARSIVSAAETEKRAMTGEEDVRFKKFFDEAEGYRSTIEASEKLAEQERSIAAGKVDDKPIDSTTLDVRTSPRGTPEYRNAFNRFIGVGERGMKPEEQRALSAGSDTAGGFTVVSEQFAEGLIKNVDNQLIIRQLATKKSVPTAASLGVMTLDADPDDADWTSELAIGNEDAAMAFGKRKMIPHPLGKLLKVSKDWLRMNQAGGEGLIRDRLAYKMAVPQEKGFMTGTGVQQALGIFTASADGIPTTQDVSTGNAATAVTFDGLLGAKWALKSQYRADPSVRWIFHTDTLLQIAKLKDGDGQYLWKESVRVGEPDRILGVGFFESRYAPNTFTSGLYVGAIGAWSNYWIVDALDTSIQRLDELYAATNQVGFIARSACDGQMTLAEAAVRVKLG